MKLKKYFISLALSAVTMLPFAITSCSKDIVNPNDSLDQDQLDPDPSTQSKWNLILEKLNSELSKKDALKNSLTTRLAKQAKQVQDLAIATNQNDFKILIQKINKAEFKNNKLNFNYILEYQKENIIYYYEAKATNQTFIEKNDVLGFDIEIKQYNSRNKNSYKAKDFKKEFVDVSFFADLLKDPIIVDGFNPNIVKNISLYNTNDLHGNAWEEIRYKKGTKEIDNRKSRVGLEKTLGYIKANPSDLLLDGGDFFAGSSITNYNKGKTLVDAANLMGYDGMAVGNHEFDFGHNDMQKYSQSAPFYSTNIINTTTNKAIYPTNFIKTIKGGKVSVGLFSLMNLDFDELVAADNRPEIGVASLIEIAKKQVQAFKSVGVDMIVGFGHVGNGEGYDQTSIEIMKAIPEIDIFVDGHTHQEEYHEIKHTNKSSSYIVQAYSYGRLLGTNNFDFDILEDVVVKHSFKKNNLNYATLKNASADSELQTMLQNLEKQFNIEYDKEAFVKPEAAKLSLAKKYTNETSMGNFFSDAQEWWARKWLENNNPELANNVISLQNAGGIRVDLNSGTSVTKKNLLDVSPFGNKPVILKVKGSDLQAILDDGAKRWGDTSYPVLSQNISLTFNVDLATKNSESKATATKIKINNINLEENKYYALAISDYVYGGGDGYTIFKEANRDITLLHISPKDEQWNALEQYGKFLSQVSKATINSKNPYLWSLYTNQEYIRPNQSKRISLVALDPETQKAIDKLNDATTFAPTLYKTYFDDEDEHCSHQHTMQH